MSLAEEVRRPLPILLYQRDFFRAMAKPDDKEV